MASKIFYIKILIIILLSYINLENQDYNVSFWGLNYSQIDASDTSKYYTSRVLDTNSIIYEYMVFITLKRCEKLMYFDSLLNSKYINFNDTTYESPSVLSSSTFYIKNRKVFVKDKGCLIGMLCILGDSVGISLRDTIDYVDYSSSIHIPFRKKMDHFWEDYQKIKDSLNCDGIK